MFRTLIWTPLFVVLVLASSLARAVPPSKAQALYLSFEQRLALSYALMAQGQPADLQQQYFTRAREYFTKMAGQRIQKVPVRNFEEFLKHFRGEWPNTHSLDLDLSLIEKQGPRALAVYEAPSARVQKKIDAYINWQWEQIKNGALSSSSPETLQSVTRFIGAAMALKNAPANMQIAKDWIIAESDLVFGKQLLKLDHIGDEITKSRFAATQDVKMKILLQTLFGGYYSRLSSDSKKLIISSYMGRNLRMDDMEKLEVLIQNSGPSLQKLLQLVARQADLPADILEVFQKLESSVKEVPWVQVKAILAKETANYHFVSFERKPLGIGTMAQVHRAKLHYLNELLDVVVRFIKPGMAERVEEDSRILLELAPILDANEDFRRTGVPKLEPMVGDINATVRAELVQTETVTRQNFGATVYNKETVIDLRDYKNLLEFHVPSIFPPRTESTELMVQEMVFGQKIDKAVRAYGELAPALKKSIVENLARLWLSEVLFGQGFYHADLHMGNFMVNITDPRIRLNILDFGMGGRIDTDMQGILMTYGAGTRMNNVNLITSALWNARDPNRTLLSRPQLEEMVRYRISRLSQIESVDAWTTWALDHGLRLPYEFVNLNRGLVIITRLLEESGSHLTPLSIVRSLALENPGVVYQRMVVEEKVRHRDIVKLGFQELRDRLMPKAVPMAATCEALF